MALRTKLLDPCQMSECMDGGLPLVVTSRFDTLGICAHLAEHRQGSSVSGDPRPTQEHLWTEQVESEACPHPCLCCYIRSVRHTEAKGRLSVVTVSPQSLGRFPTLPLKPCQAQVSASPG